MSKFYNGRCPVLCDLSAGHDRSAELNTIHCLWSDVSQYMHAWEREGRQLMWLSVFRNCIKCGLEQSIKLLVGRGDGGGKIINPAHHCTIIVTPYLSRVSICSALLRPAPSYKRTQKWLQKNTHTTSVIYFCNYQVVFRGKCRFDLSNQTQSQECVRHLQTLQLDHIFCHRCNVVLWWSTHKDETISHLPLPLSHSHTLRLTPTKHRISFHTHAHTDDIEHTDQRAIVSQIYK